eukprot:TRINITY_DN10899_c0_g1_i4.p1 TRINITY_DN10899_c0_g1~~TRINITY_DN10899_c0_g1_i4.p1  ORF type:complete len:425 (+),score=57.87 TRINITY_DN10899_c0_g1_i4:158-1432(+)
MPKRKQRQHERGEGNNRKWCEVCECWLSGLACVETHKQGIKHRRKSLSYGYFGNSSGKVVSVFEEPYPETYISNDPIQQTNSNASNSSEEDIELERVVKQFKIELLHHLGRCPAVYNSMVAKVEGKCGKEAKKQILEDIRLANSEKTPMVVEKSLGNLSLLNSLIIEPDKHVAEQAGFPYLNPNQAPQNLPLDDQEEQFFERYYQAGFSGTELPSISIKQQKISDKLEVKEAGEQLEWQWPLNVENLIALGSVAKDLEVNKLHVKVACSTNANINSASSAATVILLRELSRNVHVKHLVVRYVVEMKQMAQYAGRNGLQFNGQGRVITELLNFANYNTTVQTLELQMPLGGLSNHALDDFASINTVLRSKAKEKAQFMQQMFEDNKSLFSKLPSSVFNKILDMAMLQDKQVSSRSFQFIFELES